MFSFAIWKIFVFQSGWAGQSNVHTFRLQANWREVRIWQHTGFSRSKYKTLDNSFERRSIIIHEYFNTTVSTVRFFLILVSLFYVEVSVTRPVFHIWYCTRGFLFRLKIVLPPSWSSYCVPGLLFGIHNKYLNCHLINGLW